MNDTDAFATELAAAIPGLQDALKQHLEEYGELLPHVFMGEVSQFAIDAWEQCSRGAAGSRAVLESLFARIEQAASEGSEDVLELISVSFLENIAFELAESPEFQLLLGPALQRELRPIFAAYGYTSEPAKPDVA